MAERDLIFRAKFIQEEAVRAFESYLKTLGVAIVAFNQKIEKIAKESDKNLKAEVDAVKKAEQAKLDEFIARRLTTRRMAKEQIEEVQKNADREVAITKEAEAAKSRAFFARLEKEQTKQKEATRLANQYTRDEAVARAAAQAGEREGNVTGRGLRLLGGASDRLPNIQGQIDAFKGRATQALSAGLIDQRAMTAALQALENRYESIQQKIKGYNIKLSETGKLTESDAVALRKLGNEMTDFHRIVGQVENKLAETNIQVEKNNQQFSQLFKGAVIGGFALQQIGGFLRINVTQPLIELSKYILDITLKFDTLTELLETRAGKNLDEVGMSLDTVGKVAKLRNFDLESSVTLYSRLFEATRGAISDGIFEKVAKGISQVSNTLEAGEKRSFQGQIQDVLGGGDVANLEKTLSLAPALKSVYDEVKSAADSQGRAISDADALMEAFTRFAKLPALDDLQTKVKNIRVDFELLAERLGRLYKEELAGLADFLSATLIPTINDWLDRLEEAPPAVQNLVIAAGALVAALAPLASIVGLVTVAGFGLASMIKSLLGFFAIWTGVMTETVAATASLGTLLASATAEGTVLGTVLSSVGTAIAGAFSVVGIVIGAIVVAVTALLAAIVYMDLAGIQESLYNLGGEVLALVWSALKAIYDVIIGIVDGIIALAKWLYTFTVVQGFVQLIAIVLSFIVNTLGIILSVVTGLFKLISGIVQFFRDWANLGIVEAAVRFKVVVLEVIKGILKFLPQFVQNWFNIDKAIADAKAQTRGYGEETDKTAKKNANLTNEFKKQVVAVKELTEALRTQAQEREKALQKQEQNFYTGQTSQTNAVTTNNIDRLTRQLSTFDLSNDEQYILAEQTQREINKQRLIAKRFELMTQGQAKLAQYRDKAVNDIRELAIKAREQNKKYLADFLSATSVAIDKPTEREFAQGLVDQLGKADTGEDGFLLIDAVDRKSLIDYLSGVANGLNDEKKLIDDEQRKIIETQSENNKALLDLQEKRRQKQKERGVIIQTGGLEEKKSELERTLKDTEAQIEIIKDLFEKNELTLTEALQQIRDNEAKQLELVTQIADVDLQISNLANANDENKRIEAQKKNALDNKTKRDDIKSKFRKERLDLIKDLIATAKDTNQQARELIDAFQEENDKYIDALIGLAGLGSNDDIAFGQAIKGSKRLSATIEGDLRETLKKIQSFASIAQEGNLFGGLNRLDKFKELPSIISDFNQEINKIKFDDLKGEEIDKLLLQAQKIISFFSDEEFAKGLSDDERASIQVFIKRYLDFIEELKKAKDDLSSKTVKAAQNESDYLLAQKEYQLELLSIEQDRLELRKEKVADNLSVRATEVKSLRDLGGFVAEALTGSRRQIFELEKLALENQRAQAELELAIALERLRIEQEIFILRLQEANKSEEEINKVRKSFERQIELTKQRGQLELENIDLQISRLNQFSGSIGEIFSQAIVGLFDSLLGGKKKNNELYDNEGDIKPIDAAVPEEAADETEKSTDRQLGALGKLKGGLASTAGFIFAFGDAISKLEKITVGAIARMVKEELKALGKKYLVLSLEYAAVALAALVFGKYDTAAKAGLASAAYAVAAGAAYAGAGLLGLIDGDGEQRAQNQANASATSSAANESKIQTLKQQALSVLIRLDIYQDDSTVVKKQIKALNQNTELTNITVNQQQGWTIPQNP